MEFEGSGKHCGVAGPLELLLERVGTGQGGQEPGMSGFYERKDGPMWVQSDATYFHRYWPSKASTVRPSLS